jgi:hypothetical protein
MRKQGDKRDGDDGQQIDGDHTVNCVGSDNQTDDAEYDAEKNQHGRNDHRDFSHVDVSHKSSTINHLQVFFEAAGDGFSGLDRIGSTDIDPVNEQGVIFDVYNQGAGSQRNRVSQCQASHR